MSLIIGIDPGLASTGYGIIDTRHNKLLHIAHGTIKTVASETLANRLYRIYEELIRIIGQYKPEAAGVETLYFAKNIKTAIPVAHARGAILLSLATRQIPVGEYTPLEVKQAVTGRGRAEKGQVQQMIKILFALKELPSSDHAADALAVALCHSHYSQRVC